MQIQEKNVFYIAGLPDKFSWIASNVSGYWNPDDETWEIKENRYSEVLFELKKYFILDIAKTIECKDNLFIENKGMVFIVKSKNNMFCPGTVQKLMELGGKPSWDKTGIVFPMIKLDDIVEVFSIDEIR